MLGFLADMQIAQLIGVLGFTFYAGNYFLVSIGRVHSGQIRFFACQAAGATCVLISLCVDFNLPALMIQVFYICMSTVGITRRIGQGPMPVTMRPQTAAE